MSLYLGKRKIKPGKATNEPQNPKAPETPQPAHIIISAIGIVAGQATDNQMNSKEIIKIFTIHGQKWIRDALYFS